MSYLNDFPHTRNYDSDLGWLIFHFKQLEKAYDNLDEKYDLIETDIMNYTDKVIENYVNEGFFKIVASYDDVKYNLKFNI